MNVLVVLGHPSKDSYCAAICERIVGDLKSHHNVTTIRLADEGFVTAMSADERRAYETDTPLVSDETRRHADLLRRADALVFVYPTWWSGLPAQLKGWIERVFVMDVALRFNARGQVRPNLQHVRHIIGVSTYGSPWLYVKLVNDNGRRTITRAVRIATGWRTRTMWCGLYALDTSTSHKRQQFIDNTVKRIAKRLADE